MRILFINRMIHMERGGGETFDLEVARHLQAFGHEVSFLSGLPLLGRAKIRHPFSDFSKSVYDFCIRSPYFGWFPWDKVRGGWRLRVFDFQTFENRAADWVMKHRDEFDVLQVCELPYFVAKVKRRGLRTPIVLRLTAPNYYDPWGGIWAADAVIASGETVLHVRKTARADCHDIPNGVDTEKFRPQFSDFRQQFNIPKDDYVVLYVARFQDFKNHALLINVFVQLRQKVANSRLVLVGSGPLMRRVQKQANELNLAGRVLFLGEQPFDAMPRIYAAADVLAISSDFESFCFAALEAMASGLPIVTTDCGWVPKLVGSRGGCVVPLRDPDAFAEALARLGTDSRLREEMGAHNRAQAVACWGWVASATKLNDVYAAALKNE